MSSEQAGTPTRGALNREKALIVLRHVWNHEMVADGALARLEACVLADPRIAQIETLLESEETDGVSDDAGGFTVSGYSVQAILRGDA